MRIVKKELAITIVSNSMSNFLQFFQSEYALFKNGYAKIKKGYAKVKNGYAKVK